jgi:hypothetical protein
LKKEFDVPEAGVVGIERLSHAPRRWIGVVGVGTVGVGGVMGFEVKGPGNLRVGGERESFVGARERGVDVGGEGRGWLASGAENADPISESVSERTCIRKDGAMAGTW